MRWPALLFGVPFFCFGSVGVRNMKDVNQIQEKLEQQKAARRRGPAGSRQSTGQFNRKGMAYDRIGIPMPIPV